MHETMKAYCIYPIHLATLQHLGACEGGLHGRWCCHVKKVRQREEEKRMMGGKVMRHVLKENDKTLA